MSNITVYKFKDKMGNIVRLISDSEERAWLKLARYHKTKFEYDVDVHSIYERI